MWKKLFFDFNSEIAIKAVEHSEKGKTKNLKMQEPELSDSLVACLLLSVCCKCVLGMF